MPSPLLNVDALQKQLGELNIHYPTISNLISNSALIDQYAMEEKKALHHFREDLFITCVNRMHKPSILYRSKDTVIFQADKKQIQEICRGDLMTLTHFHGILPGYPSEQDIKTHTGLFKRNFQAGEVIGIDGIYVHTFLGQTFKIPWSPKFYEDIKAEGVQVVQPVQSIMCSQYKNPSFFHSRPLYSCTLTYADSTREESFLVDQAVIQESNEYKYSPFQWLGTTNKEQIVPFDYSKHHGTCTILQTQTTIPKRILTCFYE